MPKVGTLRLCPKCRRQFEVKHDWDTECFACWKAGKDRERFEATMKAAQAAKAEREKHEAEERRKDSEYWRKRAGERQEEPRQKAPPKKPAVKPDKFPAEFLALLPTLLFLCHPDKHNNMQQATDATVWLLAQRKKQKGR